MAVTLICRPGKTVTWEQFRHNKKFNIAVDGYCSGPPRETADGCILNINHHDGVHHLATRSSCEQALCQVKLGLFDIFRKDGEKEATIWVNDADQDVTWATYILMYDEHIDRPKLRALVKLEDHLDMSSGLFPLDNDSKRHLVGELSWICEPYTDLRVAKKLPELDEKSMFDLITVMHKRIKASLFGHGKRVPLDMQFEVEKDFMIWSLIRETGAHARYGMSEKGIKAFLTILGESEGRYRYALGRIAPFIPFPVHLILDDLNKAEGIVDDETDRWGGSSMNGGSPRIVGSGLDPEQVSEIINDRIWRTKENRKAIYDKIAEDRKKDSNGQQ